MVDHGFNNKRENGNFLNEEELRGISNGKGFSQTDWSKMFQWTMQEREEKFRRRRWKGHVSASSFGVGLNVVQKKLNFFHVLVARGDEAAQKLRDS